MIYLVLFFGLFLRLIRLDQSLWWDEGVTFTAVSKYSLLDLITRFPLGDFHPPLYYVLLMYWTKIFGYSEISLRIPSVLFGVAVIYIVYLIGRKLFSHQVGLIAGILTATSPLLIYYSQEARMYELNVLLVCMSMYLFILLINSNFKNIYIMTTFLFTNIMLLYSDYIIYLIFPVQFLFILLHKRNLLLRYLLLCILLFMFLIPWIPLLIIQMENGTKVKEALPVWASVVGGATFKEIGLLFAKTIFGRISFDDKRIYLSVVAAGIAVYGFLIGLNLKNKDNSSRMLLAWLGLPVVLALVVSWYTPVFAYFRMTFILPAFCLLVSRGIFLLPNRISKFTLFAICTVNLIFMDIFYATPRFQREDWRAAVEYTQSFIERNSVIIFENNTVPDVFSYYAGSGLKVLPGLKKIPVNNQEDVIQKQDLEGAKRVLLFEYLVEITDRQRILEKNLYSFGFKNAGNAGSNGVGTINIYER